MSEEARLTLPGDIEDLVLRCAPVWVRLLHGWARGVVCEVSAQTGEALVRYDCFDEDSGNGEGWHELSDVHLDLADATGRAHAAWSLAGGPGASWHLDADGFRRWELHGGEQPRGGYDLTYEGIGATVRRMLGGDGYGWGAADVPSLDDLNPDDPRRLADGSRWVDAEALRRVVLHVAGREVAG